MTEKPPPDAQPNDAPTDDCEHHFMLVLRCDNCGADQNGRRFVLADTLASRDKEIAELEARFIKAGGVLDSTIIAGLRSQLAAARAEVRRWQRQYAVDLGHPWPPPDEKPQVSKRLTERVERNTEGVQCECGGYARRTTDITDDEDREYGCGRPRCCSVAFNCPLCRTRWLGTLEAPEME